MYQKMIMEECRGSVNLHLRAPKMLPHMIRTLFQHTPKSSILVRNPARTSRRQTRSMTFNAKKYQWFPRARQEEAEKCGHFSLQLYSNIHLHSPLTKGLSQIFQNSTPKTFRERSWPPPKRSRIRRSEVKQVLP